MKRVQIEQALQQLINNKLIKTITNYEKLVTAILNRKTVYCGFDPTAASLHIGHFLPLYLLAKFSSWNCPVIIVIGGLTGAIGDPSFRHNRRSTTDRQTLNANKQLLIQQIQQLLPKCQIYDNASWYQTWSVASFFQTLGQAFTVNKILEKKSISQFHTQQDLFYAEFSYLLLQAYDFYHLYSQNDCAIQIGGSDQYANITLGLDLIQKLSAPAKSQAVGVTTPLLVNNQQKIGKSQTNYLALDLNISNLYDYYQFFVNLNDDVIVNWTKWLNIDQPDLINQKSALKAKIPHLQVAQMVVTFLFGKVISQAFQRLVDGLKATSSFEQRWNVLRTFLPHAVIDQVTPLQKLCLTYKIVNSTSDFKRLIQQKGIKLNQTPILNWNHVIKPATDWQKLMVFRGKTIVLLLEVKSINYK